MEGAITAAFNAAGAGGIEGIASGSARELFRHTMRQSVTSTWLAGAKEFARGTLGEVGEEVLIEALDTAFVRMSLRPDMTVGEFFKSLHDTALVTAFTSAPSSAVHGRRVMKDVMGNDGRSGEMRVGEPGGSLPGENTIEMANGAAEKKQSSETITKNKLAGDAWEKELLTTENLRQTDIQIQITIRSHGSSGKKVRVDAVGLSPEKKIKLTDAKASTSARLTKNQKIVYPEIETHGGIVTGEGKGIFPGGTIIPPTKVDIIIKK
ncbi:MAG: hypothetical protein KF712_04430 [Akkermansiaceae bacterium]|nr:hypothetical protein [Akkermansiaceae bacterium]